MASHTSWTLKGLTAACIVLGAALALPSSRIARQAIDGFPDGLPSLTPKGVRLSLENMLDAAGNLVMNPIPGEAGTDYPVSMQFQTPGLTALNRTSLAFTQILQLTVSPSTCAHPMETLPDSSAPTAQSSTSNTLCVIGGTILTAPLSPTSTTSTSSFTRSRPSLTARLSSARTTRSPWSSSPSSPGWSDSPANKFGLVNLTCLVFTQLYLANKFLQTQKS
eukprot:TRINITY_DN7394_c0_g1_i2.p1 TRINITY_DN7394_c0_g1~~TRINITY_DN7394_c0_g1_i2.p1  ORF type:complete len:221 (-),score=19.07 TRINITY_DN7394_c0_g1_i2:25-687(-)